MRPNNNLVFPSAQPANQNNNSVAQWAWDIIRASFQAVFTGTVSGSLQVQWSNDKAVGAPANQFQPTNWENLGTAVSVSGAGAYFVPYQEVCYEYLRLQFIPAAMVQTIAFVADVSGSLNDTYFFLYDQQGNKYYVWFDINSAGTDPAISGYTPVKITGATNASAATLGAAAATAIAALNSTNSFTTTGTSTITVTSKVAGYTQPAADSALAPTGFTFTQTTNTGSMTVANMKSQAL